MSKTLKIHSRDMGGGRYEVCGVVFTAKSHAQAVRKYLRKKKPNEVKGDNSEEHY